MRKINFKNKKAAILNNFKLNKESKLFKDFISSAQSSKTKLRDAGAAAAFVGAIAVLLIIAGYVINRLASDRAYREKWRDYNDCGWA